MVNFNSTAGSPPPASRSFALSRSAAAPAASRSPAVAAPKKSASTFLSRSRSSSSIAMPPLLGGQKAIARPDSSTRMRPPSTRHSGAAPSTRPVQSKRYLHDRRNQLEHDQHDDRSFEAG